MQEIRSSNKENMVHTGEVHVACPCCKNKRLFDADPMTEGIIKIKCPICKSVIAVSFHHKNIRTERIAVQCNLERARPDGITKNTIFVFWSGSFFENKCIAAIQNG